LRISGASDSAIHTLPNFPEVHWHDWFSQMWVWLVALGEPLLIGLPFLALGLAIAGYAAVRLIWRVAVMWKWHRRHRGK
jgi:hypothetical protein